MQIVSKKDSKEPIKKQIIIKNTAKIVKAINQRQFVFTEEINELALSSNDDEITQLIDSIEIYTYGTSKDLVRENEMINFGCVTKEKVKEQFKLATNS